MTTIVPSAGERLERVIDGIGTLVFENYGPGEWLTQKGEPAKKARRRYLLDDQELDAVSSIVGTLDKFALRDWIEKQATLGAVAAERMGELVDVPEEDWVERVKSLGLGATAKKDEGSERGTVIHSAMHDLTLGLVPNPAQFPAVGRAWVQGAMRAWLALGIEPGDVLASEQIVCNPQLGYAGRPDLLAVADERVTLVDYKTGKGRVYQEAHFQTRLYEMGLRCLGVNVERIVIVGIEDNGGFQLVECEATEEDARALLAVYRAGKRINAGMAAQRKLAKAAAA